MSYQADILKAFLNCEPLPKRRRLTPNFSTTPKQSEETSVKHERKREKCLAYADKLKQKEENEILTRILNRPNDDTLGIRDQAENLAIPPFEEVSEKYEFELPVSKLPIAEKRKQILAELANNQVIIIRAVTGSGKSSQVPQYILEEAYRKKENVNIIITQPRRISAQSLAQRVALERKCEVGSLVGYQIGLDRKMDNNDTRILYATTGVFLQKLINEKSLAKWSHCIIDEIHERDLDLDFVLLILRRLVIAQNSRTKVILMSATLETAAISKYFKSLSEPTILDLDIERPFPVKVHYLDEFKQYDYFGAREDLIDIQNPCINATMYTAGAQIIDLLRQKGVYSFLVFLPGWFEIESFNRELFKNLDIIKNFKIFMLHSTMGMDDIKDLFNSKIKTKIILSTNISESSITIPDIDFVIDYCLMKHLVADTSSNLTELQMVWASRNNLQQREGRVGRTKIGQVVRMIFKSHYECIPTEAPAEMQRTSLETVVLKAKQLGMGKPIDMLGLTLSPPLRCSIIDAVLALKELGALTRYNDIEFDFEDGDLTFAGKLMASLPVDVRLSKLILYGFMFNVPNEAIIIAAGLSVRSIFKHTNVKRMDWFQIKFRYGSGSSDVLAILNVYKEWQKLVKQKPRDEKQERDFVRESQLDIRNLNEMCSQVRDITNRMIQLGFTRESLMERRIEKYSERMFMIKICIAGAFYPSFYIFGGSIQERDSFNTLNYKNPCHCVYYKGFPAGHDGNLYKDQIIEHLYNNDIINYPDDADVHFDSNSSRVVVEFKNLRNESEVRVPGDVKFEIYKALRFAKHQGKYELKLNLLDKTQETNYLKKKGYLTSSIEKHQSLTSVFNEENCCIYPKTGEIKGKITCIITPGKFYIQTEAGTQKMRDLFKDKALTQAKDEDECVGKNLIIARSEKGGNLIIARSEKGGFFRAQIIEKPLEKPYQGKAFKIYLIDLGKSVGCQFEAFYTCKGNTLKERKSRLKDVFSVPPLCFEAKLAKCKPSMIYQTGWSNNATLEFEKLLKEEEKNLQIKVYAFNNYDKVASVTLHLKETPNRPKTTINDIMGRIGYSQIANESYIYHISRIPGESGSYVHNDHFDFKDYSDLRTTFPYGKEKATLCGPLSTFAFNTFERTTFCHENDVRIDNSSVNSVLLDQYPFDGVRKVLVAGCRSKNDKGKITLRHTTVLPHINGIACFLALIFCPTAEIRYDKNFNRFTSILTGMGCSFDAIPYYKEHDCLFYVDVDIDDRDIKMINELRDIMSELMDNFMTTDEYTRNDLSNKAMKKLLQIMQRSRAPAGVTLNDTFDWNGKNSLKKNQEENMRMFPCFDFRPLQTYSKERWNMLTKLNEELEEKAKYNSRDESIFCVLCEQGIETRIELKVHVLNSMHIKLRENLKIAKPKDDGQRSYSIDSHAGHHSRN